MPYLLLSSYVNLLSAPQSQTMLGAIVRIPHLVSYGFSSVVPYAKQLLAPMPLTMLAVSSQHPEHLFSEQVAN